MQRFFLLIPNVFQSVIASLSLGLCLSRRTPRFAFLAIGAATLLLASVSASAQTTPVYVHMDRPWDDQNPGNNTVDGESWATAYRFLQDALDDISGSPGDSWVLWISAGTYRPDQSADNWPSASCPPYGNCNTTSSFDLSVFKDITFYGGFPDDAHDWHNGDGAVFEDREPETYLMILSGDLEDNDVVLADENDFYDFANANYSDNSDRVVFSLSFGDQAILLDGLTVRGANLDAGVNVEGQGIERAGDVSLRVVECVIKENRIDPGADERYGGGIRFKADLDGDVLLDVRRSTIKHNFAGCGGGAYADGGVARFIDVRVIKNKAIGGGGIATENADVTLLNVDLSDNTSLHLPERGACAAETAGP